MPKFPEVTVNLNGVTSPFTVVARTITAMREAGIPEESVVQYADAATFGDFEHVLTATRATVTTKE